MEDKKLVTLENLNFGDYFHEPNIGLEFRVVGTVDKETFFDEKDFEWLRRMSQLKNVDVDIVKVFLCTRKSDKIVVDVSNNKCLAELTTFKLGTIYNSNSIIKGEHGEFIGFELGKLPEKPRKVILHKTVDGVGFNNEKHDRGEAAQKYEVIAPVRCVPYQLCPKCEGEKWVPNKLVPTYDKCGICDGKGIIPMHVIDENHKNA